MDVLQAQLAADAGTVAFTAVADELAIAVDGVPMTLAAGEPAAFTGIVRLKDCPDTLRARIGIDHRLLFRMLPDSVQVVDLINRKDLESRIKQL